MGVISFDTAMFDLATSGPGIVLVDFWASWCYPCREFSPVFEAASERHPDIIFGSVDTEYQGEIKRSLGVLAIPTVMAYRDGILVYREAGALHADELEALIADVRRFDSDRLTRRFSDDLDRALDSLSRHDPKRKGRRRRSKDPDPN